ncbi:CidA/LrgA family protein [Deinococcus maricopensis]|uniref:LrgA family protein n=1 Tax=Deinococcus maricopensis (strain DSM 21211 / LMG 22137 / NRRL B-23946 / LB-34) TaxID=709986 RepID=E8U7I3_DEIML|nr:CidA/LrgA family protein [Deinococcus maricopensis]ADV67022.1 LrgA family protein [Deinococcus maricopensis DSM 21211]
MSAGVRPPAVRFLGGLGALCAFAALGQVVSGVLPLPLPGSVVGLLLLWGALSAGWVRLPWVEDTADGLLGVLSLLFVPATVGVVAFLGAGWAWPVWLLILTAGALVGGGVAGLSAQALARRADDA